MRFNKTVSELSSFHFRDVHFHLMCSVLFFYIYIYEVLECTVSYIYIYIYVLSKFLVKRNAQERRVGER